MAKKEQIISRDELIGKIAEQSGESKASAGKVIESYPQVVVATLVENQPKEAGEISGCVPLPGFGTMAVKRVAASVRKNNLGSGEDVTIPEHLVPTVKLSKSFKIALNADTLKKAAETKKAAKDDKASKSA